MKKSGAAQGPALEIVGNTVSRGVSQAEHGHRMTALEKTRFLNLLKQKSKPERQRLFHLMESPLAAPKAKFIALQAASALAQAVGENKPKLRRAVPARELKRGVFGVIDDRTVVEKARAGLPFAEFERLARLLDLTVPEQAVLLSITERTMARRIAERGTLHPLESERLVLLQKLAEYGEEVFEDAGKFNRWLRRPLALLGDKSPLQYLDMSTGFVVVEQVLGRLAHGVYS